MHGDGSLSFDDYHAMTRNVRYSDPAYKTVFQYGLCCNWLLWFSLILCAAGIGLMIPAFIDFENLDALLYLGLIVLIIGGLLVTMWYLAQLKMEIGVEHFDEKYHIHLYGNHAYQPDIARKPSLTSVGTKRNKVARVHPDSLSRKSIPEEHEDDFREVVRVPSVSSYQSLASISNSIGDSRPPHYSRAVGDGFQSTGYGDKSKIVFRYEM